jgi:hypothetical protein
MTVTWNPSDIGLDIALSLANLKWTSTNSGSVCGRGTLGYLAGTGITNANHLLYDETTINVQGTSALGAECGLANNAELLTNFLGESGSSVCLEASTGDVFYNGSVAATFTALIAPATTIIGKYTDILHQKIWWTVAAGVYYGGPSGAQNPATNQGGFTLAAEMFSNGGDYFTIFPGLGSRQSGPAATANFKGPFALPVAAGFQPWQPALVSLSQFFFAA